MVKEIKAYQCEKCGYYSADKKKVEEHEKKRITGVDNSIDGLIAKNYSQYLVFYKKSNLTIDHEALYSFNGYDQKSLRSTDIYTREEGEKLFGFLPGLTLKNILRDPIHIYDSSRQMRRLSKAEFQRVSKY